MIPTTENLPFSFPRYIDGVCPQDYPTNYQILLNCSCVSALPEIERIYVHKISMIKVCELCYLQIHVPYRLNYNVENSWHSIVKNEVLNTKCQFCETEIFQRFQPSHKCLDCIEQYLDHVGKINLGYEIKVKNHCLLETTMNEMHINDPDGNDVV